MQNSAVVNVKINVDGSVAVTNLDGVSVKVKSFTNDMTQASSGAAGLTKVMGGLVGQISSLVAAYAGLQSIKQAANAWQEFDTATQSAANLTGAALSDIKQKATDTGLAMGRFAGDVGSAFGLVGSKMPDLLKMPSAMDSVTRSSILLAQAAKATGDAMTDTQGAEAITASLNQWGVAANDASYQSERVANVLAASAQLGSASISKVVESLRDSGTVAADAGVSIEAYNAMVQSLAAKQILGAQAGTALRNSLTILMTKGAEFKEFGISADSVNPKIVGIQTALQNLQPMLANDIAMTKIFGAENIVAAKILGESAGKIKQLTADLTGTKTASEQAAAGTKMFSVQSEMLTANLKNISALTIDNLIGPALAPSLAAVNEGLTYLAANSKTVAATINVAAEVLGMGGALYLGVAALPVVMATATAASTALGMGFLAFSANAGAGASVLTILNTTLYGTGVAAQFAASGMDKLKIVGSLVFAAYAGWEIGTYLYNNFEIARVAGAAFVSATLIGFQNVKMYAALGGGAIATGFLLPFSLVKQAFDEMIGLIAAKFAGLTGAIASSSLVPASVAKGFKEIQTSLNNVATDSAQASTQQLGLITKIRDGVTSVVDESKKEIATINAITDSTTAYSLATNKAVAAQKTLTAAVDEAAKKSQDVAAAHALQFNAIAGELKQYQDFSAKSKERYDAEKKVFDLLKERKFVGTEGEKEQLIAIEMTTAARKKQGEVVYQTVEQLKKESESLGGVTEAQKQLNLLQANNASPAILEQVKNYQKLIDLGKNTDLIGKKQIENKLFEEGANLIGIEGERFKASMELQSSSLDKNSAEFKNQIKLIGDMAEQRLRLQAVQKTAETVNDLSKETAAYKESAAAVESYNAKKGLGVGATDAQAQLAVQAQLQDSQAKQLRVLQDNIDLSKLSTAQQEIETKRRELGATATAEMAAQYVALNKQLAANNALHDAQKSLDASGLTTQAKQYLDVMQQVGVEDGKRVIALQNQAKFASTGTDRIQSLQQEIALLKLSSDDQARYNALRDVAPDQRQAVLSLTNQKIEIDKLQQSWKNTTESAVNYIEKVATGEMSLKDAFKGFVIDFNKQQIKDQLDNLKKMFSSNPVTLEGALSISDAQVSKDVSAAEAVFGKYRDAVASGTDAATDKLVTGIKDGLTLLQNGIKDSLSKATAALTTPITTPNTGNNAVVTASSGAWTSDNLGSISQKYESGKRGAATVSTGAGDHGGVSYGTYQLSSKMGTADDFVKSIKDTIFGQTLAGLKAGTAEFSAKWKDLAAQDAEKFGKIQHDYIKRTLYEPLVESANEMGLDLKTRSKALNDVVWSTGVQHGGNTSIVDKAINKVGTNASDSDLIKAIYELRSDVKVTFKSSSYEVQQAQIKRFQNEQADALKALSNETNNAANAQRDAANAHKDSAATVNIASSTQIASATGVSQANNAAATSSVSAAKGAWTFAETAVGASNQIKTVGFNAAAGDKLVNTAGGLPWAQTASSGGGLLSSLGLGDIGSSISGVVGDIKSSVTGFMQPATDLFKGLGDSGLGLLKSGMSLFSGDTKGAISGLISTGLSAAFPGIGTALGMAVGPIMNNIMGSWKVESQHLTASMQGLSATFAVQTVETKKSFGSTDHKTTYTAVSAQQNAELQAVVDATIKQVTSIGKQVGTALTGGVRYVVDMVHQDTPTFEKQFQTANANMVKTAFLNTNMTGIDKNISDVMSPKIASMIKGVADGTWDKASNQFFWRPDTKKYSDQIRGATQDGLNKLVSTTDWGGLDTGQITTKIKDYLVGSFADAGVNLPQDTFNNMAADLTAQIQDGLKFLSESQGKVNQDAPFFKNLREAVNSLDVTKLKPEEITAYIDGFLNIKDIFKSIGMDSNQISKGLIDQVGGIDALSSGLNNFTKGFFTQAEQDQARLKLVTQQTSQTFTALGMQMPATRDQFKALIQGLGQDLSSPENQAKFAELVKVSDKMAEVYSLQAKLGQTAIDVFALVKSQLDGLANSISANDIGKMLTDSISKASDANDAGKRFSEAFADAFRQQMLSVVINTVSQMVLQGIVQPMMSSAVQSATTTAQGGAIAASGMATGGNIAGTNVATGGIVAGQGLTAVVGKIKDFLQISAEVFKSPEIKALISDSMGGLADIGSAAYTTVTSPSAITASLYTPVASTAAKDTTSSSSGGGSSEDTAAKEAQTLADAWKKWHQTMQDASSGLEGNDLILSKLTETYKKADLSGLKLTGTSSDVAKSFATLSPDKLQQMALAAGVTVDTLVSDGTSYVQILKEQEKAQVAYFDSLDKYSEKGDKTTQLITRLTTAANDAGLGTDGAITLLKSLSDADWKKYATEYSVSVDTLKNTVSTGALQGIQDFTAWKKSLNDFIEPSKTAKKITDELTTSVFNAGVNSADAAKWVQSLTDSDISKYAQQFGITDKQLRDLVPSVLSSLDDINKGFKEWKDGLNQYTSSGTKITQVTKQLSDLGISANASNDALVGWVQSVTPAQMQGYADALGIPVDKLKNDVVPSVLGGLQALSKGLQDWQVSLMQYTTEGTKSSQTIKQLADIAKGYTNNDIVGWLSKLNVSDVETYAKGLGLTSEELKGLIPQVFELRKAAVDFNDSMAQTAVTAGKSKFTGKLKGMDLDLSEVDKWRAEQVKKANEVGGDLVAVENAFGRKRNEVMLKYGQSAIDDLISIYNGLSDKLSALRGKAGDDIASLQQAINPVNATDYRKQLGGQLTQNLDFGDEKAVSARIELGDKYRQAILDEVKAKETEIKASQDAAKATYDTVKKAWDDTQALNKDKLKTINAAMDSVATAILDVQGQVVKNTKLQSAFDGGDVTVANDLIKSIQEGLKADLDAIKTRRDAAQKAIDDEIASLKDLQKTAQSLRDSIKQDRESLTAEIAKASGNTSYWQQQASALNVQIKAALDPKEKLDLLSKARDLEKNATQEQIDNLKTVQQAEKDRYAQLIDFAKSLKDYSNSLKLSDLSPLTNKQRYDESRGQLQALAAAANTGDKDAQSKFVSASEAFLKESQSYNASSDQYVTDYNFVQDLVSKAGVSASTQAAQIQANIPLDDTAFAKSITEIQQGSLDRLDGLDKLIAGTQDQLQAKIDTTKIDESQFAADELAARQAAQAQFEAINLKLQAQLDLTNQQLATPAPIAINEAQYATQLNAARQNAVDLLTGLQGTIDAGQQLLTNNLATQLVDLGAKFGLDVAGTTSAVQELGGNLGGRLEAVVTTLNGGLAQVAGSVGAAYEAIKVDVAAAQATAQAAVAAAQQAAAAKQSPITQQSAANQPAFDRAAYDAALADANAYEAFVQSSYSENHSTETPEYLAAMAQQQATAELRQTTIDNAQIAINNMMGTAGQAYSMGSVESNLATEAAEAGKSYSVADATSYYADLYKLPSYDVGTDYVPEDQIAQIHEGESILTRADSNMLRALGRGQVPAAGGGSSVDNSALIQKLIEQNQRLIEQNKRVEDVLMAILEAQEENIQVTAAGSEKVKRTLETSREKVKAA